MKGHVRVLSGKLFSTMSEDRWGRPDPYWSTNHFGWVTKEFFADLVFFETPMPLMPGLIERKLKLSRGYMVWQFNAMRDEGEYIRMVAVMNNRSGTIRKISWVTATIVLPLLGVVCQIANKFVTKGTA